MGAENTDHDLHDPEEEEEALSLCDLPLDENNGNMSTSRGSRRSSSSSTTEAGPEFFEFLSNLSSEMCAAEDIIFCGKLIPFNEQNLPHLQQQKQPFKPYKLSSNYDQKQGALRRRSESLSELKSSTTRSNSTKSKILRSSRSLDYQKLHRISSSRTSPDSDMERNSSVRSSGKSEKIRAVKPRWYLFMFGMVKFPPEMDLRDIKSRQFRRNSSMMFPSLDAAANFPVNRSSGGKTSWKFLKALSCRDDASVAVTTPLCMPHA